MLSTMSETPPPSAPADHPLPPTGVRASDDEREEVVARLRRHTADGRLSLEELEQRTERAYAARTREELDRLTTDLPEEQDERPPARARRPRRVLHHQLRAYLLVSVVLLVVWAATGAGYFWPVWPLLGWGLAIAKHGSAPRLCGPRRTQTACVRGLPARPRRTA